MDIVEELRALDGPLAKIHEGAYGAHKFVQSLQTSLKLPFMPVTLQPVSEMLECTNRLFSLCKRAADEIEALRKK